MNDFRYVYSNRKWNTCGYYVYYFRRKSLWNPAALRRNFGCKTTRCSSPPRRWVAARNPPETTAVRLGLESLHSRCPALQHSVSTEAREHQRQAWSLHSDRNYTKTPRGLNTDAFTRRKARAGKTISLFMFAKLAQSLAPTPVNDIHI